MVKQKVQASRTPSWLSPHKKSAMSVPPNIPMWSLLSLYGWMTMNSLTAWRKSEECQEVGNYADQSTLNLIAPETMTGTDVGFDRFTDTIFYRSKDQQMSVSQLTALLPDLMKMRDESHHRVEHRWTLRGCRVQTARLICFNSPVIFSVEIRPGLQHTASGKYWTTRKKKNMWFEICSK